MSAYAYRRVISALDARGSNGRDHGTRAQYQCPAHEDRTPSLSITDRDDRTLICCHAGCDTLDVLEALDLEWTDLFDESVSSKGWTVPALRRVGARANGDGRLDLGGVRYLPAAGDGERKTLAAAGAKRDLWPDPAGITSNGLFVVEGEPDAVTAAALRLPAVAVPGAKGWRAEWAQRIATGRQWVVVIADADESGRRAAARWANEIAAHCPNVRLLDLDPQRQDGFDLGDLAGQARNEDERQQVRRLVIDAARSAPRIGVPGATPPIGVGTLAPPAESPINTGVSGVPTPGTLGTLRNPDPSRAKPIRWAWEARIPTGRPSLLVGNEGCGKGTLIAHLAARWSRGTLPGDLHGTPSNVLIVGDEDALDDVWTPRLYAAGADWARIWFPPEDATDVDFTSAADVERLRSWVRDRDARIVVFDALLDHLGGASVDEFKAKAVRNALRPIRRLAAEEQFAALGAMHPRKGRALTFRDLVANSHQFNAVSRSSLLLAEHPDDRSRRLLVRAKGNHAAPPPALDFRIAGHVFELNGHVFDEPHAVDWKESDLGTDDVLAATGGGRPRDEAARERVGAALTSEPRSVRKLAEATGVSKSTVHDILSELSADGEAAKTPAGWVSGDCPKSTGTEVFGQSENGNGWHPHAPQADAPDWWQS